MNRVLQMKQRSLNISFAGARQLAQLRIDPAPFLDEMGARVDREGMLLMRERAGNSRVYLPT